MPQCTDFSDFDYFCVPFFLCDNENNIITDGEFLIDERGPDPVNCDKGNDNVEHEE